MLLNIIKIHVVLCAAKISKYFSGPLDIFLIISVMYHFIFVLFIDSNVMTVNGCGC